jgi:hypothetical protein
MTPSLGVTVRLIAGVLALGLSATGCSMTGGGDQASQSPTCRQVMNNVIELIRADQASNGRDPVSENLDWLGTNGCDRHYNVVVDYLSARSTSKNLGLERCSELAGYIAPAAIKLLRQDRVCTGKTRRSVRETTAARNPGGGIAWSEAANHVGTSQRVCGPLSGIGSSEDDVFLNLGRDYPDPARFTIVLWDVGRVQAPPFGATLCASGLITTYEGVAQMELQSVGAVEIHQ